MLIYKLFTELSESEKKLFYHSINSLQLIFENYNEFEKYYLANNFNNGKTSFCFFNNQLPVGAIAVVTKEIIYRKQIFITGLNLDDKTYLKEMTDIVLETISELKPEIIKIGVNPLKTEVIELLQNIGFKNPYRLLSLIKRDLNNYEIDGLFSFKELNEGNKYIFQTILNSSFSNSKNGGFINDDDLRDYLIDYSKKSDLIGIFYYNNLPIGTYELNVDNKKGLIESIGIAPEYQGRGYGKKLLEASINKLLEYNVSEIVLTVIETNKNAYELYKKYDFIEQKVVSVWMEKDTIV